MRQLRRFLIPSVIPFLCFILYLPSVAQEKLPEIVKKILPSTVVILTYGQDGENIALGSGFFINKKGDIITNKHVLVGAHHAEIKTAIGKDYPIMLIVAEDEEADIIRASVNIPVEYVHPLLVSSSIPEVGERVAVIGSPMGLEQTVSDGVISAVREIPAFGKIYQITAPISPGSSGSPVVNMKGEVIGIATFQLSEGQNLNFAIPGERIVKLKTKKIKTLNQWAMGKTDEWLASAEGLYDTGLSFFWAGDYEKALPYFEKAVKGDPRYAEAYFLIGYCNGNLKRYTEAIEALKHAIRIKPDFADAHYNLGVNYGKLGRYMEAIGAYKQAIRIKPDYSEAHNGLGVAYVRLGRSMEAIEAFKQVARIKPDDAEVHCNISIAYDILGRYQQAVEAAKEAIRIKPGFAKAHLVLGVTYSRFGRYDEAMRAFREALLIKPDFAEAYSSRGSTYYRMGRYDKAIEDFNKAIDIKSNDAGFYNDRGFVYLDLEKDEWAIKDFEKSIELDKNHVDSYIGLSIIYFRQKKIIEAKTYYQKAIEKEPSCKDGVGFLETNKGYYYTTSHKHTISEILKLF